MRYIVLFCFLFSSFFVKAFAKSPEEVLMQYQNIPPVINYYPYSDFSFEDDRIKWSQFNNLRRKQGSALFAVGEQLFVEGYIKDINGIPIDNVMIKLIQTNSNGVYNHMVEKTNALYDSNFNGNGITYTDNRGYYRFLTVFPGHYNRRAPHIHVKFEHVKHGTIETEIYFKNHPRNTGDPKYSKLTKKEKALVTADVYFINESSKELGKRIVFNVIFNANQTTKEL